MDKRYNHTLSEKELKKQWFEQDIYNHVKHEGRPYTIDTPPPTVSGTLHIGHIFSYTQTDIIARHRRMSGYSVQYPFGFDDNGLPTERYVEKKSKTNAHTVGRSEFTNIILKETESSEQEFKDLWQSIGISADWKYCYSTISEATRKISQESFIRLLEKGFIYRKYEPAPYCTACRTSVAQAELDDMEVPSTFNDITFKLTDGTPLTIATTRPELLYSVSAVLYHPDDKRYNHLKNKKIVVPLYNHEVSILPDESVLIEKGSGLVMVSTFGDKTDVEWFKKHNLTYRQSIDFNGKFKDTVDHIAGLKVKEARKVILELLEKENLLSNQKDISHAVNTHERCKKEIEYLALEQWFLNILDHKQTFIDLADKINWYPQFMKARYLNWVENISWDWCLSRQRFYGIPFPVWHCTKCKHIITAKLDELPIDPQEKKYTQDCSKCGNNNIVPDTDVMDTWNTSSLTPYICYNLYNPNTSPFSDSEVKKFIPMSLRPQAHDIIRTWLFDTIVKLHMHHDTIPWNDVVISGHVLSDAKEKLSKSKNNNKLAPEHLLKTYSADVIRYWTASGSLGNDISFSETQLKIGQKLQTKLWNAFRFIHEQLKDHSIPNIKPNHIGMVNEWLLHTARECEELYQKYLGNYEFHLALNSVEQFFWSTFCDNYLELIKDQFFNPENYSADEVEGTRWTLHWAGLRILQWYAPYMPFVTDTIYKTVYQKPDLPKSIHETKFHSFKMDFVFESSINQIKSALCIINEIRKLKTEQQLSLKTDIKCLTIHSTDNMQEKFSTLKPLICGVTKAENLEFSSKKIEKPTLEKKDDNWFANCLV